MNPLNVSVNHSTRSCWKVDSAPLFLSTVTYSSGLRLNAPNSPLVQLVLVTYPKTHLLTVLCWFTEVVSTDVLPLLDRGRPCVCRRKTREPAKQGERGTWTIKWAGRMGG